MQGRIPLHVNTANRGPSVPAGVHLGMTTIAEVLRGAGYTAHQVGKWRANDNGPRPISSLSL